MRLALWFVLSALCTSFLACKSGPEVVVCVVDAERMGLQCVRPDETAFFLPLVDAENFVCFSPRDLERILKACKPGPAPEAMEEEPNDEEPSEPQRLGRGRA